MKTNERQQRARSDVERDERKAQDLETTKAPPRTSTNDKELLAELVEYLRQNREVLREEWVERIVDGELLEAMTREEIIAVASTVYDNYVDALETGSMDVLQNYARDLSERIIERGVETDEVLSIVLLLRDVLARSLFANYGKDAELLIKVLDAYEPAANRIMVTVGVSFVKERERVISEQQEAIRKLSTPVMKLRERLLLLPIIGALDPERMRQLTEQLLEAIRDQRAQVLVVDITGVPDIDRSVANHFVQAVEAARLMGVETILTGISSEIARTFVDLEVELGEMKTVGDLQGGLEEAERILQARWNDSPAAAE
jgi:rsbT co-antagonist protein RsbR